MTNQMQCIHTRPASSRASARNTCALRRPSGQVMAVAAAWAARWTSIGVGRIGSFIRSSADRPAWEKALARRHRAHRRSSAVLGFGSQVRPR